MDRPRYRRLVLGLHQGPSDASLEIAARLAQQLGLELLGRFVEDADLLGLAGLPFAREIGLPGGSWRPLDPDGLARDLRLAASGCERRLAGALRRLDVQWRFEVVRGSAAAAGVACGEDDILVVVEPANPAERAMGRHRSAAYAALGSPAAVFLVPRRVAHPAGPVVSVAASPGDPAAAAGAAIARATGEAHVVVEPATGAGHVASFAAVTGALAGLRERLVVVTRGVVDEPCALAISAARSVPVLVVEPDRPREERGGFPAGN